MSVLPPFGVPLHACAHPWSPQAAQGSAGRGPLLGSLLATLWRCAQVATLTRITLTLLSHNPHACGYRGLQQAPVGAC